MRSTEHIQEELRKTKERYEQYVAEAKNYNGDSGAERYMFFVSVQSTIRDLQRSMRELKGELKNRQKSAPSEGHEIFPNSRS